MAQTLTDRRDVQFVLYEQLDMESLTKGKKFSDLNKKVFEMVLSEARSLATKELLPISAEGDSQGCKFENGSVKIIDSFHRAYNLMREGEWIAIADDPEVGGQGMPMMIGTAVMELFHAANTGIAGLPMLGHGAGKLVEIFGTDKQKELYLKKMYSGQWGGTMCLTEPGAGSDVGALTSSAVKNVDGTYLISGNKIFISGGEHDMVENIIHPVLARIEGAPKGPSGISLFLVPKIRVNDDGSLGQTNDVVCTGIEEKIGLHSGPTCSLTFGGKGKCIGTLLGKENAGLKTMFHMMNEERLSVAMQSQGLASAAFLYAVNYARERLQGKHLTQSMNPDAPQVAIIEHPDVRRMLIWMKSLIEGMRSLNYFVAYCMDMMDISESDEEKESLNDLISLLTPICKAYTTERACEIIAMAMQVHGGYGACKEYPIEQLLRDNKIATIYEGTTGIQAMDLLGRKIGMKKGKVFKGLLMKIMGCVNEAKSVPGLDDVAVMLEKTVGQLGETALKLGQSAASPKVLEAFAQACPFLDCTSEVILGWMHLWRATIASKALTKILKDADDNKKKEMLEKNKEAAFYHGQIQTARYFINSVLPLTSGRMNAVVIQEPAPMVMTDAAFGA
jgi:alkylation response protein AidB-like acyl-CoA dehydrogenase